MSMTKIEKAISLLEDAAEEMKKEALRDVLADCKAMLAKGATEAEKPGIRAVIESIESNYIL